MMHRHREDNPSKQDDNHEDDRENKDRDEPASDETESLGYTEVSKYEGKH
jgi:hypothetical protein